MGIELVGAVEHVNVGYVTGRSRDYCFLLGKIKKSAVSRVITV